MVLILMTSLASSSRRMLRMMVRASARLELFEIGQKMIECVSANGGSGVSQLLPVGFFSYQPIALGLNHVGGVLYIFAQLNITQYGKRGLGKGGREAWMH